MVMRDSKPQKNPLLDTPDVGSSELGEAYGRLTKSWKAAFAIYLAIEASIADGTEDGTPHDVANQISDATIAFAHNGLGYRNPSGKTVLVTRECLQQMVHIRTRLDEEM